MMLPSSSPSNSLLISSDGGPLCSELGWLGRINDDEFKFSETTSIMILLHETSSWSLA